MKGQAASPPPLGRRPPQPQRPHGVRREHPALQLALLVACEAVAVAGLTRLGAAAQWHVDWAHFWSWLQAAPLGDALAGLLRWAMLATAWWLLATSLLYVLARLSQIPALIRGAGWLTVPFVRFAVDRALVVTLAASTVIGARAGAALAQPATAATPPAATASPAPGWNGTPRPAAPTVAALPAVETAALRAQPTPTSPDVATAPQLAPAVQREVQKGDSLWSIAAERIGEATGRDPDALGADDIAAYWWGVVDVNRANLRSGHPNLIFPGEEVVLPAVLATADGFAPGSAVVAPAAPAVPRPAPAPAPPPSPEATTPPTTAVQMDGPQSPLAPPTAAARPAAAAPAPTSTSAPAPATTLAPTSTVRAAPPTTGTPPTAAGVHASAPAPADVPATGARDRPAPARGSARPVVAVNPWALRAGLAAAVGLPVFALAGWAARLRRGRARQVSEVRPGRDVVRTDPDLEPLERVARAVAPDEAEEWIDAALRALAADVGAAGATVPELRCVRAGEMGVEVLLARPLTAAPEGWEPADGGHVWRPELDLDELRRRGAGHAPIAPALASLGATPEGPILVDLESLGALSVQGDAPSVRAFLAGVALELATASWARGVDLRAHGLEGFALPEGVATVDGAELVAEARAMADLVTQATGERPTALARTGGPDDEPCYPMVVVVGPDAEPAVVEDLVAVGAARRGVAVVAAGPAGVEWQLVVVAGGHAVLRPLDLHLRTAGLDLPDDATAAVGTASVVPESAPPPRPILAADEESPPVTEGAAGPTADEAPVGEPELALDQALDEEAVAKALAAVVAVDDVEDLAPAQPLAPVPVAAGGRSLRRREDCDIWVSVLRRAPEVSGWRELRGRRKLVEVFVYLAVFGAERPVPADELRANCWPPRLAVGEGAAGGERPELRDVSAEAFHQAMSRLRKHLGAGPDGWYIPPAVNGAYGISPRVGCDWTLFRVLVALAEEAAARHDTAAAIASYREALELVEGEPFVDVPPGAYTYADTKGLLTDIPLAVAKAAHDLAALALPADPRTALWATQQGLLVLPTQLKLFDMAGAAAAELGDAAGLERALQAKCWAHERLDPDGGVPPETMALFRHLKERMATRELEESGAR